MSQQYRRDDGEGAPFRKGSRTHRHTAVAERVWIGWWDEGQFTALACQLRQIGRDGALIVGRELPPPGRPLWLRLDRGDASTRSVRGVLSSARTASPGKQAAVIKFTETCPAPLLHAAVLGLDAHRAALN